MGDSEIMLGLASARLSGPSFKIKLLVLKVIDDGVCRVISMPEEDGIAEIRLGVAS